ncbi:hypothetical protein HQQ81_13935 [Microbacteriaceae bacterium VKM Ac-2854]|nr:hypothetical protein [Microbacteriaceae bacterium VKM Ac-2854]
MHVPQINEAEFPFFHLAVIGDGAWRVSDNRHPESDGRSVIGVIERVEGVFEVMSMRAPVRRVTTASLQDALRYLADTDPAEHPQGHLFELR